MTDLDVYFWRFFALGAGFALVWRVYPWVALMGRAARLWFTLPDEAQFVYKSVREMFDEMDRHPHWYREYVAFREVGMIP